MIPLDIIHVKNGATGPFAETHFELKLYLKVKVSGCGNIYDVYIHSIKTVNSAIEDKYFTLKTAKK